MIISKAQTSFCELCDWSAIDDVRHLVLQCPRWQTERGGMFRDIASIQHGWGQEIINASDDVALTLLGNPVEGFSEDQMLKVGRQAAVHVPPFCWTHNANGLL